MSEGSSCSSSPLDVPERDSSTPAPGGPAEGPPSPLDLVLPARGSSSPGGQAGGPTSPLERSQLPVQVEYTVKP